jgi:hypothetical protein
MAGRYAVVMNDRTVTELRTYLKKVKRDLVPEFDIFIEKVETFAKLRQEAEDCFLHNNYRAKSRRHALPLDWLNIARILNPDTQSPEVSLVTEVVNLCLPEVDAIVQDLRKVLIRQREKVSLGLVQQVDAQCLRWLSKQPGRDSVEKAGSRQRILAVIRRENYNTLENRVLKDFIIRIQNPCSDYLKRNQPKFKEYDIVKRVGRLFVLCGEALRNPMMEDVGDLQEVPHPNYVLRQEWRYAKVWKAYCRIIRHAGIAERLWLRRQELIATLEKLRTHAPKHTSPRAKYQCPIWVNFVDGKNDLLDNPFYENEEGKTDTPADVNDIGTDKDVVIDLTGRQPCRDLLIYGRHDNAKPYLQNYDKPSLEDIEGKGHFFLREILKAKDRNKLSDYFEQLYALVGGERWFILVPDDWDAQWQEAVIKSVPLPRNRVFLLWRSVAAVIGSIAKLVNPREGNTIAVIDIQQGGNIGLSKLTLALGESGEGLVPQRKSHDRHKEFYSQVALSPRDAVPLRNALLTGRTNEYPLTSYDFAKIVAFVSDAQHVVFVNSLCHEIKNLPQGWLVTDDRLLESGTRRFIALRAANRTAYYDELEALSLIVQTKDERIESRTLVEANERSPGGREIITPAITKAAILQRGTDYVDLVLCMGDATAGTHLKIMRHPFKRSLGEDHAIDLVSRVTPGQGMAVVTVMSDFLREPITLDWSAGMTDKGKSGQALTMATLEDEMERSFPPDSPDVVSDDGLWANVQRTVEQYMVDAVSPDGLWFAKASWLYPNGTSLPHGANPLERLRRKNVFGNDPGFSLPKPRLAYSLWSKNASCFDYKALFSKLANDYEASRYNPDELARLIAWTYQANYPAFKRIRMQVVKKVLDYAAGKSEEAPLFQELTLCANLCVDAREWADCMNAVYHRIANSRNKVQRDFYLLYNLLQFHPTIICDTGIANSDACWKWVQHIPYWYEEYRYGGGRTISYILKSILYFLRCRRSDGKRFLTKEYDQERFEIISDCLSHPVHSTQEKLRCLVIKYLNNKGTIDGLPVD